MMQCGNVFIFDDDVQVVFVVCGMFVIKCFFEDGKGSYLKLRFVGFDDLQISLGWLVFFEDWCSEWLVIYCCEVCNYWWKVFQQV